LFLRSFQVIIVLEELRLPYTITWISYLDIKLEPFLSLNPNGRVPVFKDPNTGVLLFESGAILEYVVEQYDEDRRISFGIDRIEEKWISRSWLHFQMSGQGPMFGQKMWFTHFHKVKDIESVLERYGNEVRRILGVIERHLRKKRDAGSGDNEAIWLVGDKCTYADLAFVTWDVLLLGRLFPEGFDVKTDFPLFMEWHENTISRPTVKKALEMQERCIATMEDTAKAVLPTRD
jgi:glutathione S-transferase